MEFTNKNEMLQYLRSFAVTPDDYGIKFKEKIKQTLLKCPHLLYVLNNSQYEDELFDEDGNLIEDGEWDMYFGDNIRPYVHFPEVQDESKNYICYKVEIDDLVDENKIFQNGTITFVIFCNEKDIIDKETGIARHDLLSALLIQSFNWSNVFGLQCELVDIIEATTEQHFVTKQITFTCVLPNAITQTNNGITSIINKYGR